MSFNTPNTLVILYINLLLACLTVITLGNNLVSPQPRSACSESKSNSLRLKKDLLCDYDSSVRPVVHHANQTTVYIALFPICLSLDESRHWLKISCWLVMKWQDEMLQWDPEMYGGLDEFYTDTNTIWVPDISVLNTPNQMYSKNGVSYCTVSSSGSVYTAINPVYFAQCSLDFTHWPYDEHTCTLILRSRIYRGPVLDILFMKANTPDLKFYKPNGNWELVSFTSSRNTKEIYGKIYFASIEYKLVLRRHASSLVAVAITPALVLSVAVLSILWMQPDCTTRIVFSSVCMLCHCILLQYLSNNISNNGDKVPLIVLFYRNSLVLCTIGLVWTVVARSLCSLSNSPYWLYNLTARLNNHRYIKHFMLAADQYKDSTGVNCEDEPSFAIHDSSYQQWRNFTVFVNRIVFSMSLLVYLYFVFALLP